MEKYGIIFHNKATYRNKYTLIDIGAFLQISYFRIAVMLAEKVLILGKKSKNPKGRFHLLET